MRIKNLQIDGYGVWTGLKIERFSDGLNVIHGPNEAGKTTLLQFIRAMLYGFDDERRRYFPPLHGGRPGGILDVDGTLGRYEIARRLDEHDAALEEVYLTAPDGTRQGEHIAKAMLANLDEVVFNNVFAVELREMQELGTLGDTEVAALLYNLSLGLDRVSLMEVVHELNASRNRILDVEGRPSQITELLAEEEKIREDINELGGLMRKYNLLAGEKSQLDREILHLEEEKNRHETILRRVELAATLRERWMHRTEVAGQLQQLGSTGLMPDLALERLDAIVEQSERFRRKLKRLKKQSLVLRREAGELEIQEPLRRQSARIEALLEQENWLIGLKNQLQELNRETASLDAEIAAEWERLGLTAFSNSETFDALSDRSLHALRPVLKQVRRARTKVESMRRDVKQAEEAAAALELQLQNALKAKGRVDLTSAMDQAGNTVAQYRRRLQLEERLDQLLRYQGDLEEQSRQALERQLTPMGILVGLGIVFILGVVLILTGLFLPGTMTGSIGIGLAMLGIFGCGGVLIGKYLMEKSHQRRAESIQKQLVLLQTQVEQIKEERESLDGQLPRGGGPLGSRLEAAEKELTSLEEWVPLETRRNAFRQQMQTASQQLNDAEGELKFARRRWRESLNRLGLPASITAKQISALTHRRRNLADARRRIVERKTERDRRQKEWQELCGRISQVAADAHIELRSDDALDHLKQLAGVLREQEAAMQRAEAIRRERRLFRERSGRLEERLGRFRHRRRELFFEAGVEDEASFRKKAALCEKIEELRRQYHAMNAEIAAAVGGQCSEESLRELLETDAVKDLESRAATLRKRLEESETHIRERIEKRGRLSAQMQTLVDDRRLSEKQLELALLDQQIEEAVKRWQVLAATSRGLDLIRESYEKERQPETLKEASRYLERLTQGRYTRVWTPLGEKALLVDDARGVSLSVEKLSRGTREQLFLGLRLALVAGYARRGSNLPLILDDVLVNFDTERATAAALLLRDFAAEGHQVLIFTCHEHIERIFGELDVPVSCLPGSNERGPTVITLERFEGVADDVKKSKSRPAARRKSSSSENQVDEKRDSEADEAIVDDGDDSNLVPVRSRKRTTKPKKDIKRKETKKRVSGDFDTGFIETDEDRARKEENIASEEPDEEEVQELSEDAEDESLWEEHAEYDEGDDEFGDFEDDDSIEAA